VEVAREGDTELAALANGYADGPGYTAADAQMNDFGTVLKQNDPYFASDHPALSSAARILATPPHSQPYPYLFLWWNLANTLRANWFPIGKHPATRQPVARLAAFRRHREYRNRLELRAQHARRRRGIRLTRQDQQYDSRSCGSNCPGFASLSLPTIAPRDSKRRIRIPSCRCGRER
jgi:hypothetical protein